MVKDIFIHYSYSYSVIHGCTHSFACWGWVGDFIYMKNIVLIYENSMFMYDEINELRL